ncbi:MAG: 50S ribosomal protein L19 [Candidatus Moranbacteria bacterium]|nr:50S ribosomal protein L19 [Candidatus Moranbacteria bacterium]
MHKDLIAFNMAQRAKKEVPNLHSGDVVKVYRRIIEGGKERTQMFQGMVIAMRGGQSSSPTVTIRKISFGIGVELVLPLYSENIEKIEVVKSTRSRRSKLYYVRDKSAKLLRRKLKEVGLKVGKGLKPEDALIAETIQTESSESEPVESPSMDGETVEEVSTEAGK